MRYRAVLFVVLVQCSSVRRIKAVLRSSDSRGLRIAAVRLSKTGVRSLICGNARCFVLTATAAAWIHRFYVSQIGNWIAKNSFDH